MLLLDPGATGRFASVGREPSILEGVSGTVVERAVVRSGMTGCGYVPAARFWSSIRT
jgi:hypothetical protein